MKSIIFLLFIVVVLKADQLESINQALKIGLDKDSYWLKLLHFENKKSTIIDKSFFLSSDGDIDAKSELIQTIKIFQSKPTTICRYPARYRWLNKRLNLNIKNQNCIELKKFLKPNFKKVKVIFTSERYDSPASIFGHTMMKIESDEIPYAINYAAKIPDKTDSISYIYKGLRGKFESGYSFTPFSLKDYEYRLGEFRDLIEFSLNLTSDEINNMMLHFYEIKDYKEDYYFLSHNCGSELIKLIDIAKYDSDISTKLQKIVIPINTIYLLEKHNYISSILKEESKLKQFYKIVSELNGDEKKLLFKIINNKYPIYKFSNSKDITDDIKDKIILASVKYFEIHSIKNSLKKRFIYPYMKLIDLEIKRGIEDISDSKIVLDKNPISNRFHKLYGGVKYAKDSTQTILGYRYLYRDRLDLIDSMKKNGSVELFDIAMRDKKNQISLDHLTLLNLEAIPISNSFFKESINKIKVGVKRVFLDDKLYGYFDYSLGYKYSLNSYFNYQIFVKGGIYYNHKDIYLASAQSTLEYSYKNRYVSEFRVELNSYTNGVYEDIVTLDNYLKIKKDTTVNLCLNYKNQVDDLEMMLLLNYFF